MLWQAMTATGSDDGDGGDDGPAASARVPPVEQRSLAGAVARVAPVAQVARVDQAAQVTTISRAPADPSKRKTSPSTSLASALGSFRAAMPPRTLPGDVARVTRSSPTGGAWRSWQVNRRLIALLGIGLAVRLALLPVGAYGYDLTLMQSWAERLVTRPLVRFYASPEVVDHLPGDLWLLWLLGRGWICLRRARWSLRSR